MAATSSLVGRDREIARIEELVAGDARALVVEGDAGVGKTALLDELATVARAAGWAVMRHECPESERRFPYAALDRLLRHLDGFVTGLAEHHREAVDIVLGRTPGEAPAVMLLGPAVLHLLVLAAEDTSTMLVVDDAHWMDSASQDVVMFAARRLGDAPVSLVFGVRSPEAAELDFSGVPRLAVEPLAPADAAQLLDARHPGLSREVRAEVLRWGVGNPLALTELPTVLSSGTGRASWSELPLPQRLEQAYVQRLERLPAGEREGLLHLALDAGGDDDEPIPTGSLDLARATGLVDLSGPAGRPVFRHPLVRSAVVGSATAEQVRDAHGRLARARTHDPLRHAYHLAYSTITPDEAVAELVERGAQYAVRRGGSVVAVQLLARAATLSVRAEDRGRRLADAAFIATRAGRLEDAESLVGRLDRVRGDLTAPSSVLADAALQLHRNGVVVPAHRALTDTLRRHGADMDEETLTRFVEMAMAISMYASDPVMWERTEAAVEGHLTRLKPVTLLVRDVGNGLLEHAVDVRRRVTDAFTWPDLDPSSVSRVVLCAYFVDAFGDHRSVVDRLVHRELEAGSLTDVMSLLQLSLLDDAIRGRWGAATRTYERVVELSTGVGNDFYTHLSQAFYTRVLAARGDLAAARALGTEVDLWARPRGLGTFLQHVECAALVGSLTVGAHDAAWTHALGLAEPGRFRSWAPESFRCLYDVVEAGVASGHQAEARRHAEAAIEHRVDAVSPRMDMLATAAMALTDPGPGAGRLFEVATSHPAAAGFPFEAARIRLAQGRWLRRHRDVQAARRALLEALDGFRRLGTPPWEERTEHELAATGAPGDTTARRLARLTAQELRIAELAASGLSNKQIGDRLYLSPRTVGTHLYRLFPKLGVSSRASLRDALGRSDAL